MILSLINSLYWGKNDTHVRSWPLRTRYFYSTLNISTIKIEQRGVAVLALCSCGYIIFLYTLISPTARSLILNLVLHTGSLCELYIGGPVRNLYDWKDSEITETVSCHQLTPDINNALRNAKAAPKSAFRRI